MMAHLGVPPLTDNVQRSKEIFHIKIYKKNISNVVAKDAVRSLTPHSSAACGDGARACAAVRLYSSARMSYMEIEVACEKTIRCSQWSSGYTAIVRIRVTGVTRKSSVYSDGHMSCKCRMTGDNNSLRRRASGIRVHLSHATGGDTSTQAPDFFKTSCVEPG